MPKILLNGVTLNYEDQGSGKALILLHGLTGSHLMLKQEMERFKTNYRVIALDSRGHGESEKPSAFTLDDHIQDVISLMDYLEIDKAILYGMSMGTYVAQGVASRVSDRVEKMILVSGCSHAKEPGKGLLAEHAEETAGLSFEEQMGQLAHHIFHNLDAVGNWLSGIPSNLTAKEQEIAADALAEFDFRPDLHKVTAKTLVISGKYDGLNPPNEGKEIAELIPNAEFVVFNHSGHAPNIEEPAAYIEVVDQFLQD